MTSDPRSATLELLWSLWSEMGVPGLQRSHASSAIDPEPLIAWTPQLAGGDARLLGLALDWCIANHDQVARIRLPGIAKTLPASAARALAGFNGALVKHGVQWRPTAEASRLDSSRKTVALPLERPALVRFRIRALCGVKARAEILALLLAAGRNDGDAAQLTPVGIARRSVERVLSNLTAAGLVVARGTQRRHRFRLHDAAAFKRLVGGGGLGWVNWNDALAFVAEVNSLWEQRKARPAVRRVNAAASFGVLRQLADALGFGTPPGSVERADLFEALLPWGVLAIQRLGQ
ncbi:MAG: hypothetical protein R3C68_09070 [Myxococcota bacterium]